MARGPRTAGGIMKVQIDVVSDNTPNAANSLLWLLRSERKVVSVRPPGLDPGAPGRLAVKVRSGKKADFSGCLPHGCTRVPRAPCGSLSLMARRPNRRPVPAV